MNKSNKILLGYLLSAAGGVAVGKIQGQSWGDAAKNGVITGGVVGSGFAALLLATDARSGRPAGPVQSRRPAARRNPVGVGKTAAAITHVLSDADPAMLASYTGETFDIATTPANPHEINVRE